MRQPSWRRSYDQGVQALQEDDEDRARENFGRAIAQGADRWEPYYAWSWIVVQQCDETGDAASLHQAGQHLDKAIEEFGGGSDAIALRGRIAALQGEGERAVTLFLSAFGRSSNPELVENGLVDCLARLLHDMERRCDTEAVEVCTRLERHMQVASIPDSLRHELVAEVLSTRAYCRERLDEPGQAEEDLRHVARLVPNHPRVPQGLRPLPAASGAPIQQQARDEPSFEAVGGKDIEGTIASRMLETFETYFGESDIDALRKYLAQESISSTRAILLYGPSGCGKTYVIRSFAGEFHRRYQRELPIYRLRLNEVLGRWVGDGEKAITRLLDQAIETQPSILFGDEVDAIAMSREGGQDWRVQLTSHFLQELDRLKEQGAVILFFGCTNRLSAVDLALLRRFDEKLPVEMPDEEARAKIFEVHLRRLAPKIRPREIDVSTVAKRAHGLTPGDIQKVVSGAAYDLARAGKRQAARPLEESDLVDAIGKYRSPMPLQEWVRQTVQALRSIGQTELVDEVEQLYGPYVEGRAELASQALDWRPVPEGAWTEQTAYDLAMMRAFRR